MIPLLYNRDYLYLEGLGDTISCYVEEERNGSYELTLVYSTSGRAFDNLVYGNIIEAVPNLECKNNNTTDYFRIYKVSKAQDGKVTVNAEHISYELASVIVNRFTSNGTVTQVLGSMKGHSSPDVFTRATRPFTITTDLTTSGLTFKVEKPNSFKEILMGKKDSILYRYHGELKFNKYAIQLLKSRGTSGKARFVYGKNLKSIKADTNVSDVYTAVYPYVIKDDDYIELSRGYQERYIDDDETKQTYTAFYGLVYPRIKAVDLSSEFDELPTSPQLLAQAKTYMQEENIGEPEVDVTIGAVPLNMTSEYEGTGLDNVNLCDIVEVYYEPLDVDLSARVTKVKWDTLKEKWDTITIGNAKKDLAKVLAWG